MNISQPISEICSVSYRLKVKDPDHWNQNVWRQKAYGVHGRTKSILLRFRGDPAQEIKEEPVDWPLLATYQDQIDLIMTTLKQHYRFTDYCAIIANLPAGESINRHIDNGPYFKHCHRIHLPIQTNPDVLFYCGGEMINMKEGTFYEISNTDCRHGVVNQSRLDRHHYIIDLFQQRSGLSGLHA